MKVSFTWHFQWWWLCALSFSCQTQLKMKLMWLNWGCNHNSVHCVCDKIQILGWGCKKLASSWSTWKASLWVLLVLKLDSSVQLIRPTIINYIIHPHPAMICIDWTCRRLRSRLIINGSRITSNTLQVFIRCQIILHYQQIQEAWSNSYC